MTTDTTRIVGFDLGHAETALAIVHDAYKDEVSKVELPSALDLRYVTATAVGRHPVDGLIIGLRALGSGVDPLYLAFKGPDVDDEGVRWPTTLFVTKMREDLEQSGRLPDDRPIQWVFGAPSGWSRDIRARYADLLRTAGLADVEVIPESRAAMLFARDSGEISAQTRQASKTIAEQISGVVLVIDLGSSTADFTAVMDLKVRPIDSGTALGASLIDKAIMEWVLRNDPKRSAIEAVTETRPFERLRLEFACRQAKENFFVNQQAGTTRPTGRAIYEPDGGSDYFPIRVSERDMADILESRLPRLERSWPAELRERMRAAVAWLEQEPDLVLLTGGASRMPFVLDTAREVFGPQVIMGAEPELAIARGLALAGRIGVRAAGFRADIKVFLESGQVATVVRNHLPDLARDLGTIVAKGSIQRHAVPAFRRWKDGQIRTLADMESQVASSIKRDLTRPDNIDIAMTIVKWQNGLHPDLAELTRPICEKWHIPPAAMQLRPLSVHDRDWTPQMGIAAILAGQASAVATTVAGMVFGAMVGMAAAIGVITGPVGWAVGMGMGILAAVGAGAWVEDEIRTADLPPVVRNRFSENKLVSKADEHEAKLTGDLEQRIVQNDDRIVEQITSHLNIELEQLAAEAELLIL